MTQQEFIAKLNSVSPTEIVNLPEVKAKYISLFDSIWKEGGEGAYARESRYFNTLLTNIIDNNNKSCARNKKPVNPMDRFSVYNAFIEQATANISLEPGVRALAYLTMRGYNAGSQWVDQIQYAISGYGEMVARIRCGQIRHADNPVVVYKGDTFRLVDNGNGKSVIYELDIDHDVNQIKACYMRITRADGSIDYAYMLQEDWKRLEGFSLKQNQRKDQRTGEMIGNANALYNMNGQIDPGFLQAKLIKHAFKTYPKVRVGGMTINAYDEDEQNAVENNVFQNNPSFSETQESVQEPTYEPQISNVGGGVQVDANDDLF